MMVLLKRYIVTQLYEVLQLHGIYLTAGRSGTLERQGKFERIQLTSAVVIYKYGKSRNQSYFIIRANYQII